ncbi:hypothetical protein HMPREF9619_01063 [Cutibacterium acnes HL082PA2]|nr:hypothetical protein HMPREF9619_01063 [Cutibacterium acnes HL082PA2]
MMTTIQYWVGGPVTKVLGSSPSKVMSSSSTGSIELPRLTLSRCRSMAGGIPCPMMVSIWYRRETVGFPAPYGCLRSCVLRRPLSNIVCPVRHHGGHGD